MGTNKVLYSSRAKQKRPLNFRVWELLIIMKKETEYIKKKFTCEKYWRELEHSPIGYHCKTCNLNVVDFTTYSTNEIIQYLSNRHNLKTCGKLVDSQFDDVNRMLSRERFIEINPKIKSLALASILTLGSCKTNYQTVNPVREDKVLALTLIDDNINQNDLDYHLIKGIIVNDDNHPIAGATLQIGDTGIEVRTDSEGRYFQEIPISVSDTIKLKTVSLETNNIYEIELSTIINKEVKLTLDVSPMWIGQVVIVPRYKRIWNKIKNVFR